MQHEPGVGTDRDRKRVGNGVIDREELAVERPKRSRCPSRTVSEYGLMRCSRSFASTNARVKVEPTSGRSGASRSR